MTCSEIVTLIINGVVAVSAAFGATAAWLGVNTWRKQLVGKSEYELARRLLKSAFEIERLIRRIRLIARIESDAELLSKLDEVGTECDVAFLEGRVLWGEDFFSLKKPLVDCVKRLRLSIRVIDGIRAGKVPKVRANEHEPIAHGVAENNTDVFFQEVRSAVEPLEEYLKKYLRH